MKLLITILFFPLIGLSQGAIIDSAGNIINYTKLADSIPGILTTGFRLKVKTDSLAVALAASTAASLALKLNISDSSNMLGGYLRKTGSAAALTSFPTLNQNTTGTAAGLSAVLNYANGGISASAATSATTGTMTVNMTSSTVTITPTGACTFNASGGVAGQILTFSITTSGTTSFVLTWGTNFRKAGTLATGTTSARFFSVTFICINGTTWQEIARTAAQT